ncbi:DUF5687 family protein [Flavobacterium lindanitolerans]|uniref:DUF5687 family protein n=1 Tax=Flavobacterium lindanitolerans TaxID=428988 RepID=UPI002807EBB7|nr:DUF5687 family protein [Flavobacterium lindanitolerans]MDQ7959333.1 DUF5687 family protein [Flavobacterium lindanitolerans]
MFKKFLMLEWKAFFRSASFRTNLALKILMIFGAIYFTLVFLFMGIGAFYLIKEELHLDPLVTVNQFLIYYFLFDLIMRLFLQKIPVMNIRPLLTLPIKKSTIVNFALGKTVLSFFNFVHCFFFVPFSIVLIMEGYDIVSVILWHIGLMALVYVNNFLNILLNNKDYLFIIFIGLVLVLGAMQYYDLFDVTNYTSVFYQGLFDTGYIFLIPVFLLIALYAITFNFFKKNLHLDTGLSSKHSVAKTEQYTWLNQFGTIGTFLKNDIRLIKRNKRSKTTIFMSLLFLFYGLLFFASGIESYDNPMMHMFAGIFVTGGFLFTFGQFVPSWDSAYYPLMMTQNIPYKGYLSSKWWLIVIATAVSTVAASFYLYFGLEVYLVIVVGAIYNIGVNSHLVLLGGAYTKTPVDLGSSKGAFGDKKAFNVKTMLISLPKLLLPMIIYALGYYLINPTTGLALVALTGILGFALKNKVFNLIERVYKTEKYKTLEAYKQKA